MDSDDNLKKAALFSIHSDPLACLGSQQAGGQNIYVRSLAEELDRLGWQVDVFTRWDDARKKQIASISKKSRVIRLKGGHFGYISKEELVELLPKVYENFLSFIGDTNPYNVFHGHYWDGGWVAQKAKEQFAKPMIVNFHSLGMIRKNTRVKFLKEQNELNYFSRRLNIENSIIKSADLIVSLAESEKDQLAHLYGAAVEKCLVIPGGVDLQKWGQMSKQKAREKAKLNEKDFYVLFVGRLEWRKGVGTLLEAMSLLKNDYPTIKAIIIGGKIFGREKNIDDYKEYCRLLKKAKEEGVEEAVSFLGRVSNSHLPAYFSACDCLVVPSYYEPFGLVALEGMASKMPVIASRVGGLASIIDENENGLLFEPHNAKELKEKIADLYENEQLRERLSKKAREKAEQHSWGKMAKIFDEIYKKLIFEKKYEDSSNSAV